jgi:hypothetical protein
MLSPTRPDPPEQAREDLEAARKFYRRRSQRLNRRQNNRVRASLQRLIQIPHQILNIL